MSRSESQLDVLVLGEHPATYLAAALLHQAKIRVLHAALPGETAEDRFVLVNPALFGLHPMLEGLRKKLDLTSVYGLQFLSHEPAVHSAFRSRSAVAHVTTYKQVAAEMKRLAENEGVNLVTPKHLEIHRLDESGLEVTLNKSTIRPRVLVLGGMLPQSQRNLLGMQDSWGREIVHRYTFLKLKGTTWADLGARPIVPMSLDLHGELGWAWLLPHGGQVQLSVEQPIETLSRIQPAELLRRWVETLRRHEILKPGGEVPVENAESIDLPLAGALAHEGVANRTLLIGPAGGFYSACAEDIYPNCWSAVYGVEVIRKALKERHLQDALQLYRHKWRTTLGDYLRGPQQNLRFLLPLVYRNQVMTDRLAGSILLGKSVVQPCVKRGR